MKKLKKQRYSVKDFAEKQEVTVQAVYKAIKEHRIDFEKIGSVYIIID